MEPVPRPNRPLKAERSGQNCVWRPAWARFGMESFIENAQKSKNPENRVFCPINPRRAEGLKFSFLCRSANENETRRTPQQSESQSFYTQRIEGAKIAIFRFAYLPLRFQNPHKIHLNLVILKENIEVF